MGYFSAPVNRISDTRIYVSHSPDQRDEQIVLYSNVIDNDMPDNFMILPVPFPETVRLYPHRHGSLFLDSLEDCFAPFDERRRRFRHSPPVTPPYENDQANYRVEEIVPMQEFLRSNLYNDYLPAHVMNEMREIYHEPFWGVMLVRIPTGNYRYNPLIYTHRMIPHQMFAPTFQFIPRTTLHQRIPDEIHWDHKLFINGTNRTQHQDQEVNAGLLRHVPWDILPRPFQGALRHLILRRLLGRGMNRDHWFEVRSPFDNSWEERRIVPPAFWEPPPYENLHPSRYGRLFMD